MKALINIKTFLRNDKQKVVANGYPDLRIYSILRCAIESLDVKMLLYPFEEKLNLPAFPIEFRNGKRVFYGEVVGQKLIDIACFIVFIHDEPHGISILFGREIACEPNYLIGEDPRAFILQSGFEDIIDHVVFGSGNGELGKAHHHKLVTSLKLNGVTVAFVAVNTPLEIIFVYERHNLCKDVFSFVHGLRMAS